MLKIFVLLNFCLIFLMGCVAPSDLSTTRPLNSNFGPDATPDTQIFTTTGPPQIEDKNGYFLLPPINVSF